MAVASALAGCGSSGPPHRGAGETVFAQNCSTCHSLTGRQSSQRQGGDLLGARLSTTVLLQFAREMPVRRPLSPIELRSVIDYIASVQRRTR